MIVEFSKVDSEGVAIHQLEVKSLKIENTFYRMIVEENVDLDDLLPFGSVARYFEQVDLLIYPNEAGTIDVTVSIK